jgi:hypothetical protein
MRFKVVQCYRHDVTRLSPESIELVPVIAAKLAFLDRLSVYDIQPWESEV